MRFSPDMEMAAELVTRSQKDAEYSRHAGLCLRVSRRESKNPSGLKADALKVKREFADGAYRAAHYRSGIERAYEMQMARNAAMPSAMPASSQPLTSRRARPADAGLIIQSSRKDMGVVTLPPAKTTNHRKLLQGAEICDIIAVDVRNDRFFPPSFLSAMAAVKIERQTSRAGRTAIASLTVKSKSSLQAISVRASCATPSPAGRTSSRIHQDAG